MVIPSATIPQLIQGRSSSENRVIRAPIWDFSTGEFQMSPEGKIVESIDRATTFGQLVRIMFITQRGVWPIYDFQFGNDLHSFIGQHPDLITARLNKLVGEALNDPRIYSVHITSLRQLDNSLRLGLTVTDRLGLIVFDQSLELNA